MPGKFTYIWLIFTGNVINIPYMDAIGNLTSELRFFHRYSKKKSALRDRALHFLPPTFHHDAMSPPFGGWIFV